jgi:hypothetical protein
MLVVMEAQGLQAVVVAAQVRLVVLLLEAALATMVALVFNLALVGVLPIMRAVAAGQVEALVV